MQTGAVCPLNTTRKRAEQPGSLHLLQQPLLDLLPRAGTALVHVHAEQDAQAAGQATRLLLQEIRLGLALET